MMQKDQTGQEKEFMPAANGFDGVKNRFVAGIPCTCGELFQGTLDDMPCLVSCPLNICSTGVAGGDGYQAADIEHRKTIRAIEKWVGLAGGNVAVQVHNPLPVGRGYGTSTADIGAALFALSRALNKRLSASEAAQVAVQIEPTDSTFFPGLTLFDHREGKMVMPLGKAPSARLIVLDPGGMVDSEEYNQRDLKEPLARLKDEHFHAFQLLKQGIMEDNLPAIAQASTMSAKIHQAILYNPLIDYALLVAKQFGALGICRAHSGTVVGLIFSGDVDHDIYDHLPSKIPIPVQIRSAKLTGGGPVYDIFG